MHSMLIDILLFTLVAVIFVPLFRWLKLGAILAYLFAGILIGPSVAGLVQDPGVILHFSELGVVFLLFIIGLELAPEKLWQLRHSIFGLGLLQVILTGGLLTGLGYWLGFSLGLSFVAGFGLALSSTAFSVQIMQERRELNTAYGQGAFAILMMQDLAVVPLLLSLSFFSDNQDKAFSWLMLGQVSAILIGLVIVGKYLIRHVLRWIANSHTQEVFTALSLLIVIGTAVLMESVGLSMGMGAFLAGVLLANSEYRHELEVNLQPFKGLLLGLFFIAVGMSLELKVLAQTPLQILGFTLFFMGFKVALLYALSRFFKIAKESACNIAFILPQGGEFAFVLFNTAVAKQIASAEQASVLNAAVTISMALTPLLFFLNKRYLQKSTPRENKEYDKIESDGAEVLIAGFGRFGQIVARFLRAENVALTILDHSTGQIEIARKFGNKVFYGDASRFDLLEAAGAKDAKFFVLAIDDVESSIQTARVVRQHFPHLTVIARARNRRHVMDLMELGIVHIHRETFLTSLEVAKSVLLQKGRDRDLINKKLDQFRRHDEDILRNQFALQADETKFVSYTIQANQDLENILRADIATENTQNQSQH